MIQPLRTALALGLALVPVAPALAATDGGSAVEGALYTASNDADGNAVVAYRRLLGHLLPMGRFPTGGLGTGEGLGNQGALALTEDGARLLVVNAGSDTISVFDVHEGGLTLVDVEPSMGVRPVSLSVYGDLVYALNAGGTGGIAGFRMDAAGLTFLPGSVRALSDDDAGAAQVGFTPDGGVLVVSERFTDRLVTYRVRDNGLPGPARVQASQGVTPFGFDFDPQGRLLVSEATGGMDGASTVSSYAVASTGALTPITSALMTGESAACWLVTAPFEPFAYVTNTGSDTVSGLVGSGRGQLALIGGKGDLAPAGDGPIDAGLSREGRFLFVLNGADDTLSSYFVDDRGGLLPLFTTAGLPEAVNGLAVR